MSQIKQNQIKDVDSTYTHMNQIFNDHFEDCNFKNLNLKEDNSVDYDNETNHDQNQQTLNINESKSMETSIINVNKETYFQINSHNPMNDATNDSINTKQMLPQEQKIDIQKLSPQIFQLSKLSKMQIKNNQQRKTLNLESSQKQQLLEELAGTQFSRKKTIYQSASQFQDLNLDAKSQYSHKVTPIRLMKAINLLVNVKGFYRQLTKNSRIFEKITLKQQNLIGDITAKYKKIKVKQSNDNCDKTIYLISHRIIKMLKILLRQIKLFSPNHMAKRLWDTFQALLIIYFLFLISLLIFFSQKVEPYQRIFSIGFLSLLVDTIFTFNTAILEKGITIRQRNKIALKYLKGNFIFDMCGLIPFFIIYLNLQFKNTLICKVSYGFIIFKVFILKDILESLSFYLSFQKNRKNLVDLLKVIFLIISVCHIFSILWHGLALYEITVLERHDTWINNQNLLDADVYVRYIYSFYYLSVTMQTVGYGDITPKNPIEIMFTVITMFCTGMIWAYSLNSIGNIIQNIKKVNKDYKDDMESIHCFMRNESIKSELRVKESNQTQKKKEKEIILKLSKQLQQDLASEVQGQFLKDIPIIKDFVSQQSQLNLIPFMEEILFSPGEIIFRQQEVDDCAIYYIVKGTVQLFFESRVSEEKDHQFQILSKKQQFGEISFLTGQVRGASARASDFCRLFKIKRDNFLDVIKGQDCDFENFQMVKEAVSLKNNLKFASMRCYQCNQGDHLTINCPKTQLTLTKQIILQKYNFSEDIKDRITYQRRYLNNPFRTRQQLHEIQDAIFNIINNPENEEYLINFNKDKDKQQSQISQDSSSSDSDDESDSHQEEDSQYISTNQQSDNSFKVKSDLDSVNTQIVIKQPSNFNSAQKRSSIFQQQIPSYSRLSSYLDQKTLKDKQNSAYQADQINRGAISESDIDQIFQINNKKINTSQTYIDPQLNPSQDHRNSITSYKRKSSQVQLRFDDLLYPANLGCKDLVYDDNGHLDNRKRKASSMKQINDKPSTKEVKIDSSQNLNGSAKEKNKPKDNPNNQKYRQHQNNRNNIEQLSTISQIQNLVSFFVNLNNGNNNMNNNNPNNNNNNNIQNNNNNTNNNNNNHNQIINQNQAQTLNRDQTQVNFQYAPTLGQNRISQASIHNLHRYFTSQTTQNDQNRISNMLSIQMMNRMFEKLRNYAYYYPHNNSTIVLQKYSAFMKKQMKKQLQKKILKGIAANKKQIKKNNQSKAGSPFSKEVIDTLLLSAKQKQPNHFKYSIDLQNNQRRSILISSNEKRLSSQDYKSKLDQ